jgi:acetate---CoA ligase (ADP-forming)
MSSRSITSVLYPDAIAVVGASKDPTKRGFRAIERLLTDNYPGAIYPINPKESEILGLRCYKSLDTVPGPVDLALVCTPARTVPDILRQGSAKGVKGAVVLAGGFAEAGEEGAQLQQCLTETAHAGGVLVVGPNTSGLFNTHRACNIAGFANLRKGDVALLSQSGNMALSLVTEAEQNPYLGFSTYVGIGNAADLQFHEYLDYCGHDDNTRVVVAYIEGLQHGRAFLDTLRRVALRKPVVVFKAGRTSAGHSSAKSHTGVLAGNYTVSEGVLRQAGAVLVRESDAILSVAETLSLLRPLKSRRVAVLADGGGQATIAADTLTERGLVLASLSPETRKRLAKTLPPAASLTNPVDVAGGTDANPAVFADCARILLEDPNVDGLLIVGLFGGYAVRFSETLTDVEDATSDRIADLHRSLGKPVVVYSLYCNLHGDARPEPLRRLRRAGVPAYGSLETAVRCVEALAEYGEARARLEVATTAAPGADRQQVFSDVLAACRRGGRTVVLEHEARRALAAAGIVMSAAELATDRQAAVAAFRRMGGVPVAMKIVSRDILHKSEAGGVRLNLKDETNVAAAFDAIEQSGRAYEPAADIAGVLVTPMAPPGGVETIIGVVRDPQWGPVMMFGLGGVLVEVLRDVVFRALPVGEGDAAAMLDGIKAKQVLSGVRGAKPVDRQALIRSMCAISDLCTAFPEIAELDLNPVMALPEGLAVLDARILLERSAP